MGIYVNDNGTLRNIVAVYANDNGTLRQIVSVYVNDNGTLRHCPVTPVQLDDDTYSDSQAIPGTAQITLRLNADGNLETAAAPAGFVTQYAWLLSGTNSDYELFVHNDGPDSLSTGTLDTWLDLGTSRTYQLQNTGLGTKSAVLQVQIRRASDSEVLATATITLEAIGL